MRFLLYNVRYGTGSGGRWHLPWGGYLRRTGGNLENIIEFVRGQAPDVVGLVEVDAGSYRSRRMNQATMMAEALGHYHVYQSKYASPSWARRLPLMNNQANAFLSRDTICRERFHYFSKGVKRLVIELELENIVIFLVHLSLSFRTRHHQLNDLFTMVRKVGKPCIVAGDFNAFWGDREIRLFLAATRLVSVFPFGQPTFPSWKPRRQLDFILHSPEIEITNFQLPRVEYSDHLPLVCDFDIN
ncbi:MAG: endonuclease/exonuclease/phosphatase family protein [Kiritimatiellia bacterium]